METVDSMILIFLAFFNHDWIYIQCLAKWVAKVCRRSWTAQWGIPTQVWILLTALAMALSVNGSSFQEY